MAQMKYIYTSVQLKYLRYACTTSLEYAKSNSVKK